MITCVVESVIDAGQVDAFELFAREWMCLVDEHGGQHHGYQRTFMRPLLP